MPSNQRTKPADHWPHCECVLCEDFYKICCEKPFTSYAAYARHMNSKAHVKPIGKRQRTAKVVIIPDGLGQLIQTTATEERLQAVSLASISRFSEALNSRVGTYKTSFNKTNQRKLNDFKKNPDHFEQVQTTLAGPQGLAVFQIARAVNLPPSDVTSLLVSYGLELLSSELNRSGYAPAPKSPTINVVRMVDRQPPKTGKPKTAISRSPVVPFAKDDQGAAPRPVQSSPIPGSGVRPEDQTQPSPGKDPSSPRYL